MLQHCLGAPHAGCLLDLDVRYPILPLYLWTVATFYQWTLAGDPGHRNAERCRQDNNLGHSELHFEEEGVTTPDPLLHPLQDLADFGALSLNPHFRFS
ncbi:hypothetical protein AAHC03_022881 [Spirometra sp. Aus1]